LEVGASSSHSDQDADVGRPLSAHRALIAVAPVTPSERGNQNSARPAVPFLAQLIATKQGLAQTRTRRRAGVGEALGAYRTTAKSAPSGASRAWGRSV
jgi:hypothetical protein